MEPMKASVVELSTKLEIMYSNQHADKLKFIVPVINSMNASSRWQCSMFIETYKLVCICSILMALKPNIDVATSVSSSLSEL